MRWFSLLPLLSVLACHNEPSGPEVAGVYLSVVDVSCTEVWLRLRTNASPMDQRVDLWRDGVLVKQLNIGSPDTVLLDEGLLPNHSYQYHVASKMLNATTVTSEPVPATTLDTTSHNFTWEVTTLGDGSSSLLYDVAFINDTLAYAVGEMYLRDSLGVWDLLPYNHATWNGDRWLIQRVSVSYRGSPVTSPLYAVFVFSPSDIWFSSGVPIHGDGAQWQQFHLFDMGVLTQVDGSLTRIWGSNSNSLYFVGNRGTVVHHNGSAWQRLESGTTQYFQDIDGVIDPNTSNQTVMCAASHPLGYGVKKILSLSQNSVDTVAWPPQRVVMSVWLSKASMVYTCGSGVFRRGPDQRWKEIAGADVIPTLTERVRGTADNDIFVVGDFGVVAHFNGVSFRLYPEARVALAYTSVAMKGNTVIAVGYASTGAVILHGRRH